MTGAKAIGVGLLALVVVGFVGGGMVAMAWLVGVEWALAITSSYLLVLVFAIALGITSRDADRAGQRLHQRHRGPGR